MTNLLRSVVESGTGRYAKRLLRPAAGKTGTTNDSTDAWFIGFTPQIVASVWVGYDDQKTLGKDQTGGGLACPIWTDFMEEALKEKPKFNFDIPENIVFVPINKRTGLRTVELGNDSYMEAFVKGKEPQEESFYADLFDSIEQLADDDENDDELEKKV